MNFASVKLEFASAMTTPPPNVLSTCGKQLLVSATNKRPKESQKRTSRANKGREKASPASKEENKGESGGKTFDKKDGALRWREKV